MLMLGKAMQVLFVNLPTYIVQSYVCMYVCIYTIVCKYFIVKNYLWAMKSTKIYVAITRKFFNTNNNNGCDCDVIPYWNTTYLSTLTAIIAPS